VSLTLNQPEPLESVLTRLGAEPAAWVRLAAARYGESWEVELCDIVTGAPPISWQLERLSYPDALLIATRTKGSTVGRWLTKQRARIAGHGVVFPELNPNPQVQREASKAASTFEISIWPTVRCDLILNAAQSNRQQPQQMMVANGMPTFPNFATAARYLLRDSPAIDSTIYRRLSLRHQDTSARIALVEYTDTDVWVTIEGDQLRGVTVEVSGPSPGPKKKIVRTPSKPVHLKLDPASTLRDAFVVLVRDQTCLDRKPVAWSYPVMQDSDVRRLSQFDPEARLQSLLWHKENDQVEFKLGNIGESDTDKESVMKSVAAYANGNGGSLFFGINKRYEVVGIKLDDVPVFEDDLSNMIDDWVHPSPSWSFDTLTIPGNKNRVVVELTCRFHGFLDC